GTFFGVSIGLANGQFIAVAPPYRRRKIVQITPGFVNLNYRKGGKTIERDSGVAMQGSMRY
ncbi:MAG: hypothetical protein ACM36C_01005, partial [Acidobacteriota bacterium]